VLGSFCLLSYNRLFVLFLMAAGWAFAKTHAYKHAGIHPYTQHLDAHDPFTSAHSCHHCPAGDWLDDMKHGQGTSVYPSGNTYSGSWMHDQRQGQGSMVWATKAQRYTGHWVQGLPDGFGEHVWEQQRPALGLQGANHAVHVMHNRCASSAAQLSLSHAAAAAGLTGCL
jgi:hypothetical protein